MTEIEKLYELAGIKKQYFQDIVRGDYPIAVGYETYPPFTAEKQIELIKWVAIHQEMYTLSYEREFLWCSQTDWQSSYCYENFEESIANLIITLWQDLTEAERKEIKEILK